MEIFTFSHWTTVFVGIARSPKPGLASFPGKRSPREVSALLTANLPLPLRRLPWSTSAAATTTLYSKSLVSLCQVNSISAFGPFVTAHFKPPRCFAITRFSLSRVSITSGLDSGAYHLFDTFNQ